MLSIYLCSYKQFIKKVHINNHIDSQKKKKKQSYHISFVLIDESRQSR